MVTRVGVMDAFVDFIVLDNKIKAKCNANTCIARQQYTYARKKHYRTSSFTRY